MTAAVTRLTGHQVVRAQSLSGLVQRVELDDGRLVVVKQGPMAAEVAGLRWLADAVPVPAILGADDDWLVLEWLPPGQPTRAQAEQLGRDLAALHALGATAFGQPPPGGPRDAWIGRAAMVNEPMPSWPQWYAEHRITPYLRRSGITDTAVFDRVVQRLPELAGPDEPPARLHGDLWHGNVVWTDDHAALIDPAAHGGHRETDLAMLALFGCPELNRLLAAYQEVSPLADGWTDRVALHQLFPLLVHAELFGGGYVGQAVAAARRAGR
jgi:fructosamine-3-kinase